MSQDFRMSKPTFSKKEKECLGAIIDQAENTLHLNGMYEEYWEMDEAKQKIIDMAEGQLAVIHKILGQAERTDRNLMGIDIYNLMKLKRTPITVDELVKKTQSNTSVVDYCIEHLKCENMIKHTSTGWVMRTDDIEVKD